MQTTARASSPTDTKTHVIQSAIEVLKTQGMEGLTMRKVAAQAGMSLGNLQYHYPSKTALIAGLVAHYFAECEKLLDDYEHKPASLERQLHALVLFHLSRMEELSDMCKIFREIWALSTRDPQLHEQLMGYYRVTLEKLSGLIAAMGAKKREADLIASLFLPFIEGYSITAHAMPVTPAKTAKALTRCYLSLLSTG